MDIISFLLAKKQSKEYTDTKVGLIAEGFQYQGYVATISDLPTPSTDGYAYSVGSLGMYVYKNNTWNPISKEGQKGAKGDTGAEGKTADVYFNGASKLDAQNIARIEVNPNQTDQTTAKLTKLKIDGINYALQGGGASVYANISAMVTDINAKAKADLELGWNLYIRTIDVPDLWVSKNDETTSVPYTYTTDAQFVTDLNTASSTGLQIGYYRVNALESEKVNVPVTDVQQDGVTIVDVSTGIANTTPKTSTTLPATMVSRTQYILGNKSSTFAMVLPTAKAQDYVIVEFDATGSFTPTCSVTPKGDTIPSTTSGKHYSFLFTYNGANWVFSYLYY